MVFKLSTRTAQVSFLRTANMLQPGFKPLSSCALPLGALAHYCIASLSYNSVPKCITSSLFGINKKIVVRDFWRAQQQHITLWTIQYSAPSEKIYMEMCSLIQQPYPELHVHKINDRHHHPLVKSHPDISSHRHTPLVWGTLAYTCEWKTALAHTAQSNIHRPNVCTGKWEDWISSLL